MKTRPQWVSALIAGRLTAMCATLEVGPGKQFERVGAALAAAKDGDVIEVAAGDYVNEWLKIRQNNLTIRGVGSGRARFVSTGMIDNGKGIFVVSGNNLTVENLEFVGARVRDCNGAGIRPEGSGLVVRNCRFYDCEDGIQGGSGEILIEHCVFDHCGHSAGSVATHSVYISQRCTRLTFRYNYSTHTHDGHLLKSRAKESWVMYNRLTDEDGAGSAVADFPNGGLVVLVGNLMHKGPKGHNNRMIAVGMEGLKHERNEIYVVNNTMWWNNRRPNEAWFVRLENRRPAVGPASGQETDPQPRAKAVILNNICIGPIGIINREEAQLAGNLLFRSPEEAGFVDFDKFDFHLKPTSPCRDRGRNPGEVDGISLKPVFHYLHPASFEKRPEDGALDVGAYECRAR